MKNDDHSSVTDKNLDRLAEFLVREMEQPYLAAQIPDGAHLFHGSFKEEALTQTNLRRAMKTLLGMVLGFVEDAPLIMLFEYQTGQYRAVNLLDERRKQKISSFVETLMLESQHQLEVEVSELPAA